MSNKSKETNTNNENEISKEEKVINETILNDIKNESDKNDKSIETNEINTNKDNSKVVEVNNINFNSYVSDEIKYLLTYENFNEKYGNKLNNISKETITNKIKDVKEKFDKYVSEFNEMDLFVRTLENKIVNESITEEEVETELLNYINDETKSYDVRDIVESYYIDRFSETKTNIFSYNSYVKSENTYKSVKERMRYYINILIGILLFEFNYFNSKEKEMYLISMKSNINLKFVNPNLFPKEIINEMK